VADLTYTVSRGDNLSAIAARYHTTVHKIVRANPAITNPDVIHVGATLRIPDAQIPTQSPIIRTLYSGPKDLGCGGVVWMVEFELPEEAGADGWIIQKISRSYDIKNPDGSVYDTDLQSPKWTYFEAWQVKKGEVETFNRYDPTDDGPTYDDSFDQPKRPGSKGEFKVRAVAKFYELDLPRTFVKNNGTTRAFDLPSTVHRPDFWDDGGTAHNLTVTWDCTSCSGSPTSPCPPSRIATYTGRTN
jgi:LysM repeat protein